MKSHHKLIAEMETIKQKMAEAKKNEKSDILKAEKHLCKEFGSIAFMPKGSLTEGRKKK